MGQEDLTPPPEEESSVDQEPAESSQADGGTEPVQEQPSADGSEATPIPVETAEQSTPSTDEVEPSQPLSDKTFVTDGETSKMEDDKEHRDRLTRAAAVKKLKDGWRRTDSPEMSRLEAEVRKDSRLPNKVKFFRDYLLENFDQKDPQQISDDIARLEDWSNELRRDLVGDSDGRIDLRSIRESIPIGSEKVRQAVEDSKDIEELLERARRIKVPKMLRYAKMARQSAKERYDRNPERYASMPVSEFVESMTEYIDDTAEVDHLRHFESSLTETVETLEEEVKMTLESKPDDEPRLNPDDLQNAVETVLEIIRLGIADSETMPTADFQRNIYNSLFAVDGDFPENPEEPTIRLWRAAKDNVTSISKRQCTDIRKPAIDQFIDFIKTIKQMQSEHFRPHLQAVEKQLNEKWGEAPHPDEPTEEAA